MRLVSDDGEPMSLPELKSHGDDLLRNAREEAQDAIVLSMQPMHFLRGGSYRVIEIRRMQEQAREAAQSWQKVDGLLSELLLQFDRSKRRGQSRPSRLSGQVPTEPREAKK